MTPYPRSRFFPAFQAPPAWVQPLVGIFANNRERIDSLVVHDDPIVSNDVLRVISDASKDHRLRRRRAEPQAAYRS